MKDTVNTNFERVIDFVFKAVAPHGQYSVIRSYEAAGSDMTVVPRVHEFPKDYESPFSSTDYDYKLHAVFKLLRRERGLRPTLPGNEAINDFDAFMRKAVECGYALFLTDGAVDALSAYTIGAEAVQTMHGRYPVNLRALVAATLELGPYEAQRYEY